MTNTTRPSATQAAQAVAAGSDEATKRLVCRGVLREAGKICMNIGGGTLIEGVEEVVFIDTLQKVFLDYLEAKRTREHGAVYVGITANLHDSVARAAETIAASPAKDQEQAAA